MTRCGSMPATLGDRPALLKRTGALDSEAALFSEERPTLMLREAAEAGEAVRRFLDRNAVAIGDLGKTLRALGPAVVVTCARGSLYDVATYGKYLIETRLGIPVSSFAPSVASVYEARDGKNGHRYRLDV